MPIPIQLEFDFMRPATQPATLDDIAVGWARARFVLERLPVTQALVALHETGLRFDERYRAERARLLAAA